MAGLCLFSSAPPNYIVRIMPSLLIRSHFVALYSLKNREFSLPHFLVIRFFFIHLPLDFGDLRALKRAKVIRHKKSWFNFFHFPWQIGFTRTTHHYYCCCHWLTTTRFCSIYSTLISAKKFFSDLYRATRQIPVALSENPQPTALALREQFCGGTNEGICRRSLLL